MFWTLIKKEIHETFISYRFVVAAVFCFVLLPFGVGLSYEEYQSRRAEYEQARLSYQEKTREENAIYLRLYGLEGQRSPSPLSFLAGGLEYRLPSKIIPTEKKGVAFRSESGTDAPEKNLFGGIDFTFITIYVSSLLAFIFTFGTVAGEKEQGTVRLVLSNAVSRSKVVISKILGGYLVFSALFLSALTVSLILLLLMGGGELMTGDYPWKILTVVSGALLFCFAMFCLGTFFSIWTGRTSTAMVSLLLVWVFFVLVTPKASPLLANLIRPVESRQVVDLKVDMVRNTIEAERYDAARTLFDRMYVIEGGQTKIPWGKLAPDQKAALGRYLEKRKSLDAAYRSRLAREVKKIEDDYAARLKSRSRISMVLSRLSPANCFSAVATESAGTGRGEIENLRTRAGQFQAEADERWYSQQEMIIATKLLSPGGAEFGISPETAMGNASAPKPKPPVMEEYHMPSFRNVLGDIWVDSLLLGLYALLFFTLAYVKFLHYDVR